MNKIAIIIRREYLSRVRQRMFLIVTFVVPILIVLFYAVLAYLMLKEDNTTHRRIAIINKSHLSKPLIGNHQTTYEYVDKTSKYTDLLANNKYYSVLEIPENIEEKSEVKLYSKKKVPATVSDNMSNDLSKLISKRKFNTLIDKFQIPKLKEKIKSTNTNVRLTNIYIQEGGKEKIFSANSAEFLSFVGMIVGFIIFFLVTLYGGIVMKGVVEEKSNRIIEVIVSSVKPHQLMIGKIMGIALVGFTQIIMWGLMLGILFLIVTPFIISNVDINKVQEIAQQGGKLSNIVGMDFIQNILGAIDLGLIVKLLTFGFLYAVLGYILYASLFAAAGSAADNDTDTQQLSTPIIIPLMLAFYISFNVGRNPESTMAFWFSVIPFTSPIVMPTRIPFGVPWWEILLSVILLVITIIVLVAIAAKIYRTGILMYGKKASFKEILKWISYKN